MFTLLQGLKVIDLTTVALGPYATQTLGDMGAEVIKVESREGDVLRAVRPGRRPDLGVGFLNFNRNKRSIVIDLKQREGQEILHRLVEGADVFVHNMRSRSAAGLGVSAETLHGINPGLVTVLLNTMATPEAMKMEPIDAVAVASGSAAAARMRTRPRTMTLSRQDRVSRRSTRMPPARRGSFVPSPATRSLGFTLRLQ